MKVLTFPVVLMLNLVSIQAEMYSAKEALLLFNRDYKFNLNIFLKMNSKEYEQEYLEMLHVTETPKIVINDLKSDFKTIREFTNGYSLTVVYLYNSNFKESFELMDKLLWKLHLSHILIIWNSKADKLWSMEAIFQQCWQKGFVNVILWHQNKLFTYKPFPHIKTLELQNFSMFAERSYLRNFHHYAWILPFTEFSPRVFSYTDRWGKLMRSGSFYKIVELFVLHHNGTLNVYDIDMWSANITEMDIVQILMKNGFHFMANIMFGDVFYTASDALWIFYRNLIVPTAQGIHNSLYLTKSFSTGVWLIVVFIALVIFCLIYYSNNRQSNLCQQSSLLKTLAIVIGLSDSDYRYGSKLFNMLLLILSLLAAVLLVSFYNCNLSSLLITKLYEPELTTLEDISKTNLFIYEYTVDEQYYKNSDLPAIIYRRLMAGNNTYMLYNRKNLNVHLNIFAAFDDVSNYYLLQQRYLKKPRAKILDEGLYGHTFHIPVVHRLPVLDHFNRYLLYIKESGIVNKLIFDSQWDGIVSGDIQFFRDEEISPALTLQHFQFGFIIWLIGLMMASLCFVVERLRK
ncbi:uncharacterized protein LOC135961467 [Calliphora vicina]|uniref:uncharacterized protein LOC135961467 n=1 Tax=Calliphora vicina TaxID=7373 RepID=UPI00325AF73C